MSGEVLLRAERLTREFSWRSLGRRHHVTAVDGVSLVLERGRTLAVVGNSGAGKSTLGRMLIRLIEPDRGTLAYRGTDMLALNGNELRKQRRHMQMIFQDPFTSFDPRLTIHNALDETLRIHFELSSDEREKKIHDLLDKVRLGVVCPRSQAEPALGRGAATGVARARPCPVPGDRRLRRADLRTRRLDPGAQILNLLLDLQESEHLSLVFISHDLRVVRAVADDVMVMRGGQVVEYGSADDLYESPREEYTRQLLRAVRGDRTVRHGRVSVPDAAAEPPTAAAAP